MDFKEHTTPEKLIRYSFLWLIALLGFSAIALFLGGRPAVSLLFGSSMYYSGGVIWSLLNLSWIICGVAAAYLTYQWMQHDKTVFGGNDTKDTVAFWFMLLAGYNLGITGLLNSNIYFNIFMSPFVFLVTGVVCIAAALYLFHRWKGNKESVFGPKMELVDSSEESSDKDGQSDIDD